MRNRLISGALACALLSGGAVAAFAVPASDTTLDFQVKPGSTKAGTKDKPKITSLQVTITGATKSGTGQPSTSTALNTVLPKQWKINAGKWPSKSQCSFTEVNTDKNASSCPKASKVGSGTSQAKVNDGKGNQDLTVTAFVIKAGDALPDGGKTKKGDIGFFLKNVGGASVNEMIVGSTPGGNKLNVAIPKQIQEPFPGLPTGITLLKVKFAGKIKVNGKNVGILTTTGCKNKKWKFTETNVYRDGKKSDSDTVKCSAA